MSTLDARMWRAAQTADNQGLQKLVHAYGQVADDALKKACLAIAVENGHVSTVKLLLAAGARLNEKSSFRPSAYNSYTYMSPLERALRGGHPEITAALIAAGADVDLWELVGFTSIPTVFKGLRAAKCNCSTHPQLNLGADSLQILRYLIVTSAEVGDVRCLLTIKADVRAAEYGGLTALQLAEAQVCISTQAGAVHRARNMVAITKLLREAIAK